MRTRIPPSMPGPVLGCVHHADAGSDACNTFRLQVHEELSSVLCENYSVVSLFFFSSFPFYPYYACARDQLSSATASQRVHVSVSSLKPFGPSRCLVRAQV